MVTVGPMRFTVLTPQMVRMQWSGKKVWEDRATFAVVNRCLPVPAYSYRTAEGYFYLSTDSLTVRYKIGTAPQLSDGSTANLSITFSMDGHEVLWYPGKDDVLNLKGTTRTLDFSSGDAKRAEMEGGVVSRSGWALLDESPKTERGDSSRSFAFGKNACGGMDWLSQTADSDATDWYFFGYGHRYKQALGDFAKIAGHMPMPPAFAFGYWYSRYWRYTAQDIMDIVDEAEAIDVPLDVMVIDKDWHTGDWTGWSWNKSLIPDPKGLMEWLHRHGLKVTLNVHPADGVNSDEDGFTALCADMGLPAQTTSNVPWRLTDTTFCRAFFKDIIRLRENDGTDFWWLDWQQWLTDKDVPHLGETFWCNHVFYEDMRLNHSDRRPLILHRWGGMGSHRYPIGFSGDTWANFQTLAFEPYFTATAANSGYGYWSHDIGGHNQYGDNDAELYLRWLQFGVFSPILRTHASNGSNIERRIWKFSNFALMREALQLRVRLFPYIYTAAREAYDTGVALCRPLYYDYPEEAAAYECENEYLFGNDILVAPVTTRSEDGLTTRQETWLPGGRWWNVCRSALVDGDVSFSDNYAQGEIPHFFRAGSIIPLYPVQRSVTSRPDTLTLKVVPGADGQGSLYEDEGDTEGYKDSIFSVTPFSQHRSADSVTLFIGAHEGSFPGMAETRCYRVEFLGQERPTHVDINGTAAAGWTYEPTTGVITVKVPRTPCGTPVTVAVASAEMPHAGVEPLVPDSDFTEGVQKKITYALFHITGSAVPGGTQKLMAFPNSQYKFAGTLNRGTFRIINTEGIVQGTRFLVPSAEDANALTGGTAFTVSTDTSAAAWHVTFPGKRYKITVNNQTKTLTGEVAVPWQELFLVGGCAQCGWTEGKMLPMKCSETNPYLWTWTGVLKNRSEFQEPKRFKIMGQNGWSPKSIHPYTQDENALTSTRFLFNGTDDNKWQIAADGFYRVTLNLLTETFRAEYLGTETGVAPARQASEVQVTSAYRTIVVRSKERVQVKIYDAEGTLRASASGTDLAVNMDAPGIYLTVVEGRPGNVVRKILLK
jgi:hypothetical protein